MDTCNKGFNYGILDELRACQEGLKKSCTGLLPSKYPVQQIARQLEAEASKYLQMEPDETGLVCVFEPKKAISYFLFHFKYHRLGATTTTRVLVALTGDGLRLTAQSEGLFAAGLKHVDPRLKSQQQSPSCPWFQSKTEYFPLVISFSSEKEALPYMRALDRELLRIEKENTFDPEVCSVVGICADTPIFIKVVKPEDMKFCQTETGRGGACKNVPFFCHMCSCMSQRPSAGQPTSLTCPFPELQCTGTCRHWKICTKEEVEKMEAAKRDLDEELGEPYHRSFP